MKGKGVTSLVQSHNSWLLTMSAGAIQPMWSETPVQLVEPALMKHTVPLITYRVFPWKTTQAWDAKCAIFKPEKWVGYCTKPTLTRNKYYIPGRQGFSSPVEHTTFAPTYETFQRKIHRPSFCLLNKSKMWNALSIKFQIEIYFYFLFGFFFLCFVLYR